MNNATVYDELDMAISAMIGTGELKSGATLAGQNGGELADLVQIASQLLGFPRPDFKTRLKTELEWVAAARPLTSARQTQAVSGSDILPSLFGLGSGMYPIRRVNFAASVAMHAAVILLVAVLGVMAFNKEAREVITGATLVTISDYVPPSGLRQANGGGGGGDAEKLKASEGSLPKVSSQQITPPTTHIPDRPSKLMVEPTIVAPNLQLSQLDHVGDPLSRLMTPSDGTGLGSGIGSSSGGGVGPGRGIGFGPGSGGGYGGGVFRVGNGVTEPRVIYDPEPEYSPEARAAKYQGTVTLWAIIGSDGRTRELRVQQSLGMGLDEKAMEAVRTWRFHPATKDGHPVAVEVEVEVSFHLY